MNKSMIIADNNSEYSEKLAALLREKSISVHTLANGYSAAEELNRRISEQGKLPAVLVVDFSMPDLDGVELLGKLSREGNLCTVIALSCDFDDCELRNVLRAPVIGVIAKNSPEEVASELLKSSFVGRKLRGNDKECESEVSSQVVNALAMAV